ncbi:MAG: TetR/AcrR family transcriptional regulator [Thermomicrobiales bacterium]
MAGRPRTITDAAILEATGGVIGRLGPGRLTLADVAAEIGLVPATLIQRFGSKRGLLLAFAASGSTATQTAFNTDRSASPLQSLFGVLARLTEGVSTPEALANHLAFLQIDLSDAEFHRYGLDQAETMIAGIQRLLDAAIVSGELRPCDTDRLARDVHATYNGSLVTWAIFREGSLAEWLRNHLESLLRPYGIAAPEPA